MVGPGVFRHYKSTALRPKLYRVMFVATWRGPYPDLDGPVQVVVGGLRQDASLSLEVHSAASEDGDVFLFDARWSGNDTTVYIEPVVVYVALYDDGRVSVRSLREFEEYLGIYRRFERIGD